MFQKNYLKLKKQTAKYNVWRRKLWCNTIKAHLHRLIIANLQNKMKIMRKLHDKTDHAEREFTYYKMAQRYFWKEMWINCAAHVEIYVNCQRKSRSRVEEALYSTKVVFMFQCIVINVLKLSPSKEYKSLCVARCDFFKWVEAKTMHNFTSKMIVKFL